VDVSLRFTGPWKVEELRDRLAASNTLDELADIVKSCMIEPPRRPPKLVGPSPAGAYTCGSEGDETVDIIPSCFDPPEEN
jgi:hypothetical protein